MHTAPPVRYPVKPSQLRRVCEGGVFILALLCITFWVYQAEPSRLQVLGALCLCMTALAFMVRSMADAREGELVWDGANWMLHSTVPGEFVCAGGRTLHVVLDLQGILLLRWRPVGVWRSEWIWLERHSASSDWHMLRCAVYSRAAHEPSEVPTGH